MPINLDIAFSELIQDDTDVMCDNIICNHNDNGWCCYYWKECNWSPEDDDK